MEVLQLKIVIDRIKPAIWRRILVKSTATLYELHHIIQIAFGWENYHLYTFSTGGDIYGDLRLWDQDSGFNTIIDVKKTTVKRLLWHDKAKIKYEYDMGDGWIHNISLEKTLKEDHEEKLPLCMSGKRCCPPEDCGGLPGYYGIIDSLSNPEGNESREIAEWLGYVYDPEYFNIDEVNNNLSKIKKIIREYEIGLNE